MGTFEGRTLTFNGNGDTYVVGNNEVILLSSVVVSNPTGAAVDCYLSDGTVEYFRMVVPSGGSAEAQMNPTGTKLVGNRTVQFIGTGCFCKAYVL